MRTLAALATALFGVTLGFASAGPVAGNGNSTSSSTSMCDMQCRPQKLKFSYAPGTSYFYKYSTKTEAALEQTSDEKSTIFLDADVTLHVIDHCRFAIKVDSAKLDEEISGGSRKPSQGSKELGASLMKNSLVFNFENGVINRLCPAVGESKFALNVKRGIISMIQNTMADFTQNDIAFEDDVTGECRTDYIVSKNWGGEVTIVKKKSLSDCKRDIGGQQQVVSALALPRNVAKSSSMINGTQECQQVIKKAIFQSVVCRERHVVRPLSRHGKGASTDIYQRLELYRSVPNAAPTAGLRYAESDEQTLAFEHVAEIDDGRRPEERAATILRQLAGETSRADITKTNGQFAKLVKSLRSLRYSSLKTLTAEFRGKRVFLDALINTLTGESMKLTAELVKERAIGSQDAKEWLVRAALATDVEVSLIPALMPLLDMDEIALEAHLAVSAMARTYLEQNPSQIPVEIHGLLDRLYAQLTTAASEKLLLATAKAIGNLGISSGREHKLLEATAQRSVETRIAAVEAFRRLPCDRVDRRDTLLLPVFARSSENVEVRVAAYLNSIVCPTPAMIETVKAILVAEPKGSQLASFVFTHVKNLAKRASFSEDLSAITSDETLGSLELDSASYTKHYFYEMFFNPLDMGFELDAGTIQSEHFNSFLLNTTFDVFGRKVNVFDSKIRVREDLSSLDGFVRFFGKEVFYKSVKTQQTSEFESIMKSIMSPSGWKFTRSMTMLDTEIVVPAGNGLPLSVSVTAITTLAADLKAMPLLRQQGSKYVAEARSAPSLAMQFEVSMMVHAPKTSAGIKLVATASSQWEINGRVNMDLSDTRMVRNIEIGVPRNRSDVIDIKSNVYLVGADTEHELLSADAHEQQIEMCSGKQLHILAGHQLCLDAVYPKASGPDVDVPFFLLRGPSQINVRWLKTDRSLDTFHIESSFIYVPRELLELSFVMDTPGSQVDRRFNGRLYSDFRKSRFGIDLISPLKKASLEGSYQLSSFDKKLQLLAKLDGRTELTVTGGVTIARGRVMIVSPFLGIALGDQRQLLLVKSEIALQGDQKVSGDVEIRSVLNADKPVRMTGEYSAVNDKRRLKFDVDSQWFNANVDSSLSQQASSWNAKLDGDYTLVGGSKQQFGIGGKLVDDNDGKTIAVDGELQVNGKTIASGRSKFARGAAPASFSVALDLLQGRFKGALSLATEKHKSLLNAMATVDNRTYAGSAKFQLTPQLSSIVATFDLPDQPQRTAQLLYDVKGAIKRLVVESDLFGTLRSARLSYVSSAHLHKVNANARVDKETFQLSAALGTDSIYQAKLDVVHNGSKLATSSFGVSRNVSKPDVRAFIGYRGKTLLALTADNVVESRRLSTSLAMTAPIDLSAKLALGASGDVGDTLRLEGALDVRSHQRAWDLSLSSSSEISFGEFGGKINVETSVRSPDGTTTFIARNAIDSSSWAVEWRLQPRAGHEAQHLLTSGTYSLYRIESSSKLHLRGTFEMNARALDHHAMVEELAVSCEISADRNEVDFRTEVTKNTKTTVLLIAFKAGSEPSRKHLSAQLGLMGQTRYHVQWTLDGHDLHSGWRSFFDGRWQDETIAVKGSLRWDGANVHADLEMRSSLDQLLPTVKAHLETQNAGSTGVKLINAEYAIGDSFVKAEATVERTSLQAAVRTSFDDWRTLNAKASWQLSPKARLLVEFSTPKFPNTVVDVNLDVKPDGRNTAIDGRAQLAIPSVYGRGNLFETSLTVVAGQGKLNVLQRGQPWAKLVFGFSSEPRSKSLSATLTYDETHGGPNGRSPKMVKFDLALAADAATTNGYDVKATLLRNGKQILDVSYGGSLRTDGGIFAESRLEAKTTLVPTSWRSVYLLNKLIVDGVEHARTHHEFGTSPTDVLYGVAVSGSVRQQPDVLVGEAKLDGRWRSLQGSLSVDVTSDRTNSIALEARAESNRASVFSTRWTLARRHRIVELAADWDAPQLQHKASLNARSGIEDGDSFVLDAALDRNQDDDKRVEITLRLPLGGSGSVGGADGKDIEGRLKVKMPEELGGQALSANVMAKQVMFSADAGISINNGRQTYEAAASSSWSQGVTLNGVLKDNGDSVAKIELAASWRQPAAYKASVGVTRRQEAYTAKLDTAWTPRHARLSMEATSNRWQRNHFVRGSYSLDSSSAELKVDVADFKLSVDSTLVADEYKLQADARYNTKEIGALSISYNPAKSRGSAAAVWYGKRVSATFEVRLINGRLKIDFPTGSSALSWQLDELDKMAVQGHWTFHSHDWRLEVSADPRRSQEADAALYYRNQRVGTATAVWRSDDIRVGLQLTHAGAQHEVDLSFSRRDGSLAGVFKLRCPWLLSDAVDSKLNVTYSRSAFDVDAEANHGRRVHSLTVSGKLEGERVVGSLQIRCPIAGDMSGHFDGTIRNSGSFKVKFTSNKLRQPVELDGLATRERVSFDLKMDGFAMSGNVFNGVEKFGFELRGNAEQSPYELVAVVEVRSSIRIMVQTPRITKTGIVLTRPAAAANYAVEGDWLGRKILTAKWVGKDDTMRAGVLTGVVDLSPGWGKHSVVVSYDFLKTPSLTVELDGRNVFVGGLNNEDRHAFGTITMSSARWGNVIVDFKHQSNRQRWLGALRISQNDNVLGGELRLEQDVVGSLLRVDTPRRSLLMELMSDNGAGKPATVADGGGVVVGRVAWDHGRDPQKSIEVSLSRSNTRAAANERRLTISIPKLGEKVNIRLTRTDDGRLLVEAVDSGRSASYPRMTLTYSKEGKLSMNVGNLMMQAEISPKRSELVVRRMTSPEDDVSVGYQIQGNTLSARLNWAPRILANYQLAVVNMMKDAQKGHDNKQDRQWKRIIDFVDAEISAVSADVQSMISDLKRLYEQNTLNLKTLFEGAVHVGEQISQCVNAVTEHVSDAYRQTRRLVTRYGKRLAIARTVLAAIQREIQEDVIDGIEQWLEELERSISSEPVRRVVQRVVGYVRQDFDSIIDAVEYAVDEYVCEFSSRQAYVSNKRCSFVYELYSQRTQHGVMLRLPVAMMASS